jgi:hypothetical protein
LFLWLSIRTPSPPALSIKRRITSAAQRRFVAAEKPSGVPNGFPTINSTSNRGRSSSKGLDRGFLIRQKLPEIGQLIQNIIICRRLQRVYRRAERSCRIKRSLRRSPLRSGQRSGRRRASASAARAARRRAAASRDPCRLPSESSRPGCTGCGRLPLRLRAA